MGFDWLWLLSLWQETAQNHTAHMWHHSDDFPLFY